MRNGSSHTRLRGVTREAIGLNAASARSKIAATSASTFW